MADHELTLKVRHSETGLYQMAQHNNYYIWMEMALLDFLEKLGWPLSMLSARGVNFPLVEANCQYLGAAHMGDQLLVQLRLLDIGLVKATFGYTISRQSDGACIAKAEMVHVCVDGNMRPVLLNKRVPELYNALLRIKEAQAAE